MKPLIMLLDDDVDMLRSLSRLITKQGYEVLPFSDPAAALSQVRKRTPAVILTDVNMPDMSGNDVAQSILAFARGTQVVVMTGDARAATVLNAYQAGASDYLSKPLVTAELFRVIELAAERYSRWRRVVHAAFKPAPIMRPAPHQTRSQNP